MATGVHQETGEQATSALWYDIRSGAGGGDKPVGTGLTACSAELCGQVGVTVGETRRCHNPRPSVIQTDTRLSLSFLSLSL